MLAETVDALGRVQSTVSRLCKAPDVAAMIADERAKISAAENEQANAVKRERAREQSRKSSAVRRERKAKAQLEQGRSQARRRGNGKALSDQDAAALEALIYPERAPLARVVLASGSLGYDPRDDAEVVRIARLIADEPEVASLDHDDLRTVQGQKDSRSSLTDGVPLCPAANGPRPRACSRPMNTAARDANPSAAATLGPVARREFPYETSPAAAVRRDSPSNVDCKQESWPNAARRPRMSR